MQRLLAITLLVTLFGTADALAQRGPRRGGGEGRRSAPEATTDRPADGPKSYDDVIPEDAETRRGLFMTHVVGDKLFYEIPTAALGIDMLWVTTVSQTTAGASNAGMPVQDRVIRWEQRGEKILLRDVRYSVRAEMDDPFRAAVEASNLAPILKSFDVAAYGKDKRPVIEVTDLFTSDVDAFSAASSLSAGSMDSHRSFIEMVKAFPINIETEVLATYNAAGGAGGAGGGRGGFGGGGAPSGPITAVIHHSMIRLPETPMTPRRHDERVGFFSVNFTDFADDSAHDVDSVRYITRWRLEKQDPTAEVSDPVKPIVFYVSREVPAKWKPYVKAGIDAWQPAFEAAGFSNAIRGEYAPDEDEDPDWDPADARISSIRWLPSDVENAFGPHVHDPRTGEILEADVRMFHNAMKLVRDWYFIHAAACDERAQKLPMPDDLLGELLQFVVTHEVGHSLGLPHNMKSSSSISIEQLRDPEWTKKNGTATSIMDYARFNYVAQPGDGAALMPRIGPYDLYSVNWGYRQFDDADVEAELEALIKLQIDEPMYRFGGGGDPTARSEDLSNDAIEATRLGLLNLERIAAFLVDATCREGEDYDLLANMYGELWGQWSLEMGHVASMVGGTEEINIWYGDADQRYFPIDANKQRRAAEFLVDNALRTPLNLIDEDISRRLSASGVADRVASAQTRVLRSLVNERTFRALGDQAARQEHSFGAPALLELLRKTVFAELIAAEVEIDLYRRNLQRAYVDMLAAIVNPPPPAPAAQTPARRGRGGGATSTAGSDLPALARWQLTEIRRMIVMNENKIGRAVVRAHVRDLVARIDKALDSDGD